MPHNFEIQNDINSFSSLQQRTVVDNPDWSPDQVNRHALIVFNTDMFPKQVRSHFAEIDGTPEMNPDQEYDVVNGKLAHKQYGPFDLFIKNASSEEERASLVLFQETMVNATPGTQGVSLDVSQGIHAIQYADIGIKDGQGTIRIAKRIDITQGKGPMNLEDALENFHTLSVAQEGRKVVINGMLKVGLLVIPSTERTTIERTVAQVRDFTYRKPMQSGAQKDISDQYLNRQIDNRENSTHKQGNTHIGKKELNVSGHTAEVVGHITRSVLRDTGDTMRGVYIFFQDRQRREEARDRIFALPVVEQIRRLLNKKDPFQKIGEEKHRERKQAQQVRSERLTLEKIREKPVRMVEVIEKRYRKMRIDTVILGVIAETGIAGHAAAFILASLAEQLPTPVRAGEKSMRRHKKRELRMKNYELRKKARGEAIKATVKVQPLKAERVTPLKIVKERRKQKRRLEGGGKRVATAELLTPIASEKRERQQKRRLQRIMRRAERVLEHKRMPKREKKLWVKLALSAAEFKKLASQGQALRSWEGKKRLSSRPGPIIVPGRLEAGGLKVQKEREAIVGAQFAWAVWMILNHANFPPVESKIAMLVQERRGAKLFYPKGVEHGGSPWVLLSIIWYLTAIREQGMKNYPMKKKRRTLPKQGIIFAFAS